MTPSEAEFCSVKNVGMNNSLKNTIDNKKIRYYFSFFIMFSLKMFKEKYKYFLNTVMYNSDNEYQRMCAEFYIHITQVNCLITDY